MSQVYVNPTKAIHVADLMVKFMMGHYMRPKEPKPNRIYVQVAEYFNDCPITIFDVTFKIYTLAEFDYDGNFDPAMARLRQYFPLLIYDTRKLSEPMKFSRAIYYYHAVATFNHNTNIYEFASHLSNELA